MMEKQPAGFKFGKYRTEVMHECGEVKSDSKIYRLVMLSTSDRQVYYAIRIYNTGGKFLKQLLFEPWLLGDFIELFTEERGR